MVDNPLSPTLDSDSASSKNKMALCFFVEWEDIRPGGVEIGGSRFYFKHTWIPLMQRHIWYLGHVHNAYSVTEMPSEMVMIGIAFIRTDNYTMQG